MTTPMNELERLIDEYARSLIHYTILVENGIKDDGASCKEVNLAKQNLLDYINQNCKCDERNKT